MTFAARHSEFSGFLAPMPTKYNYQRTSREWYNCGRGEWVPETVGPVGSWGPRLCWNCGRAGHLSKHCSSPRISAQNPRSGPVHADYSDSSSVSPQSITLGSTASHTAPVPSQMFGVPAPAAAVSSRPTPVSNALGLSVTESASRHGSSVPEDHRPTVASAPASSATNVTTVRRSAAIAIIAPRSAAIAITQPQPNSNGRVNTGAVKPVEKRLPPAMDDQDAFPALGAPRAPKTTVLGEGAKPAQSTSEPSPATTATLVASPVPQLAAAISSTSIASTAGPITPSASALILEKHKALDYYAPQFVQGWLKNAPPVQYDYHQPAASAFPPLGFADKYIAEVHRTADPLDHFYGPITARDRRFAQVSPLDPDKAVANSRHYAETFTRLLGVELHHTEEASSNMVTYESAVSVIDAKQRTYLLDLPAVREDSPRLGEGDLIFLRGVNHYAQSVTPWMIEATIIGIQKARGLVYITSDYLASALESLPIWRRNPAGVEQVCFQVRFKASAAYTETQQDALRRCAKSMTRDDSAMRRWLFPELEDVEAFDDKQLAEFNLDDIGSPSGHEKKLAVTIDEMAWHDTGLNVEQKTAITGLVNCHHRVPYLISGPPGTGKTRTLAEAVVQILRQDACHNVLVCAPSNTAADTIARRILHQLDDPSLMFRLNNHNRSPAEVRVDLHRICRFDAESTRFDLPSYPELMKFRVVVCSLQDAELLRRAHASNTTIMHAQYDAAMLFNPRQDSSTLEVLPHWTHLVIDEAAQASEPEVLIPLAVVNPYRHATRTFHTWDPTVVLCGDQHQLGPMIGSTTARHGELDVSLFERLFARNVYHTARVEHPYAWEQTAATKPFTALIRNYRSHEAILMFTSSTFYDDRLLPSARDLEAVKWSKMRNANVPVAFIHSGGVESWVDEGSSWYNQGEIRTIIELIQSLLAENPQLHPSHIAVITAWREQVWRMRAKLRDVGLGQVDVGNVEAYQGAEFKVTILSTVRSQKRFVDADIRNAQGFMSQPRRYVARKEPDGGSRQHGAPPGKHNLEKCSCQDDPNWRSFLRIAALCDVYSGPELDRVDPTDGVVPFIAQVARARGRIHHRADVPEYEYRASAIASQVLHEPDEIPVSRSSSGSGKSRASRSPDKQNVALEDLWRVPVGEGSSGMARSASGGGWATLPKLPEHKDW